MATKGKTNKYKAQRYLIINKKTIKPGEVVELTAKEAKRFGKDLKVVK